MSDVSNKHRDVVPCYKTQHMFCLSERLVLWHPLTAVVHETIHTETNPTNLWTSKEQHTFNVVSIHTHTQPAASKVLKIVPHMRGGLLMNQSNKQPEHGLCKQPATRQVTAFNIQASGKLDGNVYKQPKIGPYTHTSAALATTTRTEL